MEEVGDLGRTVLFVSHNMAMISNLCQKGIVLDAGRLSFQGPISEAVLKYYQGTGAPGGISRGFESENAVMLGTGLIGVGDALDVTIHDELIVRMKYRIKRPIQGKCVPNFHFFSSDGNYVFVSGADGIQSMPPGDYSADCIIPGRLLNEGAYFVGVALTTYYDAGHFEVEYFDKNALTFNVIDPMDERSSRYGYAGPVPGVVRPSLNWKISKEIL